MKKYGIIYFGEDKLRLINIDEISTIVDFGEETIYKFEKMTKDVKELELEINSVLYGLNEVYKRIEDEVRQEQIEILENTLSEKGELLSEQAYKRNLICYDVQREEFFNLNDCEEIEMHEFWDGHNHVSKRIETKIELKISETFISLDKFDGNTWNSERTGYHERIYKLLEEDNDNLRDQDVYILIKEFDYVGVINEYQILDIDEAIDYIAEKENDGKYSYEEEINGLKAL